MVKSQIITILDKYPVIALAVSGGSDSMAMAEWFRKNRPADSFVILNIDHHIRGEESKRDSDFVESYAKKHHIKYYHYDIDAVAYAEEHSYTIEQSARILRHKVFEEAASQYAYAVATAHHMQDQVESVFMHIARGSGIDGLIGMNVEDGHIIRPLLLTSKEEIWDYIKANDIAYLDDSTNSNNDYSRNFVRNNIIPTIKQKYPTFDKSLLRLSERAKEISDFVDSHTPILCLEEGGVYCDFEDKHKVIKAEMIKRAFSLLGVNVDIEERHIDSIIAFFESNSTGSIDMPYDTVVFKEDKGVVICKKQPTFDKIYRFSEGCFEIGGFELQIQKAEKFEKSDNNSKYKTLYIAVDNAQDLCIRVRKQGDKIAKFGSGTKSLGDFLTDKKVPQRLRDRLPIIANGSNVICVCGVEISSSSKVEKDSKQIFKIDLVSLV